MTDSISITKLKKTYKSKNIVVEAVKGINLKIKEGEFFGLLGPNGAGKTTTINILSSLTKKTSGNVKVNNYDVEKEYELARASIGLVPQEFNFDIFKTVNDTLIHQAGFFGIPAKEAQEKADKLLKRLGIEEKKHATIIQLSGGMKRRLLIARALMHDPKIIILDEPTAGVDVELRHILWKYMQELNKEGKTILLTTHYIEEAQKLCERVAIIKKGEIVALDTVENLLNRNGKKNLEEVFLQLTMETPQ